MAKRTSIKGFTIDTYGEDLKIFEPTAARCSSSSSTCCIACWSN